MQAGLELLLVDGFQPLPERLPPWGFGRASVAWPRRPVGRVGVGWRSIIMGKGKEGKQETDYVRIHNLCRTLFSHSQSEEFGENEFHNLFEFEKSLTSMINVKFHEYIRKNKRINQGKHKMINGVPGRENNKNSVVTVILNNCHQNSDLTIKQKCSRKCNVFVISNLNESALLYFFPWDCYM